MVRQPRPTDVEASGTTSSSDSSPERTAYEDDTDFFTVGRNDSQSSLGQLSLRDMNMSPSDEIERERRISPVSRLPPEILMGVFAKLSSSTDLLNCMLVSKHWARNSAEMLWHRPLCNTWTNLSIVTKSILEPECYFPYSMLVRRLNLSNLAEEVNDGSVQPFNFCKRIERLTLTGCKKLTDLGVTSLIDGSKALLALDVTGLSAITDHTLKAVSENCGRLQGLNITDCSKVTDESLMAVAQKCRSLKRLKLNNCSLITDDSILTVAKHCLSMLEIDLHNCRQVTNVSITALIQNGHQLRELRVGQCHMLTDHAFLDLPKTMSFESLRILDLTACLHLHDEAVEKIIEMSPRLRNLVLAKCKEITDRSVLAITKLGKNLHYIHLGHCAQVTDAAVVQLVKMCNRIRYIDLACCVRLTDTSVRQLATLPKLRRIGLVKCQAITDRSILALAKGIPGLIKGSEERRQKNYGSSLLERVHLSYCTNLTIHGIHELLNQCPKLTHLSLTGVQAFYADEHLTNFCREAPPEFTDHQRNVFCVFSGEGVNRLRQYLNEAPQEIFDADGTMFDDGEADADDGSNANAAGGNIATIMQDTAINDDDEEMDEGEETSQYDVEAET